MESYVSARAAQSAQVLCRIWVINANDPDRLLVTVSRVLPLGSYSGCECGGPLAQTSEGTFIFAKNLHDGLANGEAVGSFASCRQCRTRAADPFIPSTKEIRVRHNCL
jgi:hypothetical protein